MLAGIASLLTNAVTKTCLIQQGSVEQPCLLRWAGPGALIF